ncbi:tenecin-1-like [Euwallacea similis]|uniref:tenecin-1-like n=1 Tax=Euwallacea similis TaxID=1736056 RepID=UPI00344F7CFE
MKTFLYFFVILAIVVATSGAPLDEELEDLQNEDAETSHVIVKRATCDLLGFSIGGFSFNDSACAAHCLTKGKRGGYCSKKKVCICRR